MWGESGLGSLVWGERGTGQTGMWGKGMLKGLVCVGRGGLG